MAQKTDTEGHGKEPMKMATFVAWLLFAGVIAVTGAVYIGKSDEGPIDVAGTIGRSNQAIVDGGGDQSGQVDVVSQVFQDMPNGGLVPQGSQSAESSEQPVVDTVSGTTTVEASTTVHLDPSTTTDSALTE